MKKISFLIFMGVVMFAISCRKEKQVSLSQQTKPDLSSVSSQTLLGHADLVKQMQQLKVSPYGMTNSVFNGGTNTTEVINTYVNSSGSYMHVALADFGFLSQKEKDNFLSGASIAQAPAGSSTSFFVKANPSIGYMIDQYSGKGAVAMTVAAVGSSVGMFSDDLTIAEGSYIHPSVINNEVPGWEIFDANNKIGYVILLVNNRFGIVVDGTDLAGIQALKQAAASFDFVGLTALGQ